MRIACAACALLAACGFHAGASSGDGGDDDGNGNDLVDTTFTMGTVTGGDAQATELGLEPDVLLAGGLHGIAYLNNHFSDTATWEQISAATGAQRTGEGVSLVPTDYQTGAPNGLGLGGANVDFGLVMDGEVQLTGSANMTMFRAACDDHCFVQIASAPGALDANTQWLPAINKEHDSNDQVALPITESGWYPIRVAFDDTGGGAHWQLFLNGVAIAPQNLRVRARGLTGLVATAFAAPGFTGALPVRPLNDASQPPGVGPYDAAAVAAQVPNGTGMYSLRWAGQLYSDGTRQQTVLRVDDGQGNGSPKNPYRIWIDHEVVADTIRASGAKGSTDPMTLAAGWHDLAVDLSVRAPPPSTLHLRWSSVGKPEADVPRTAMRPAATQLSAEWIGTLVVATGATPFTPTFALPSGVTIDRLDLGMVGNGNTQVPANTTVAITACGQSTPWTPTQAPAPSPTGWYFDDGIDCMAMAAGNLSATLTPGTGGAQVVPFGAETYRGGAAKGPFAPAFTYVSAPFATPSAAAFGKVHVDGELDGATVTLAVRVAADPSQLDAAAWTPVALDAAPSIAPLAYVQYQLAVTSDGWHDPLIRKVTISVVTK